MTVDAGVVRWTTRGTELVARECLWQIMPVSVFCGVTGCRIKFHKKWVALRAIFFLHVICMSFYSWCSITRQIVGDKKAFGQFIGRFKLINELS